MLQVEFRETLQARVNGKPMTFEATPWVVDRPKRPINTDPIAEAAFDEALDAMTTKYLRGRQQRDNSPGLFSRLLGVAAYVEIEKGLSRYFEGPLPESVHQKFPDIHKCGQAIRELFQNHANEDLIKGRRHVARSFEVSEPVYMWTRVAAESVMTYWDCKQELRGIRLQVSFDYKYNHWRSHTGSVTVSDTVYFAHWCDPIDTEELLASEAAESTSSRSSGATNSSRDSMETLVPDGSSNVYSV